MDTLVVIPAYNEEKTISEVVKNLKRFGYEVLVVDDGSTDQTAKIAEEAGAIVLRHLINLGSGAAIKTGLDFALERKTEIIVTFDADGQHYAEDIIKVVQPIKSNQAEVVVGSRFKKQQKIPLARRLMNWLANLITLFLFGLWVSDSQSGFKAFSRKALEEIEIKARKFDWSSEIVAELKSKKIKFLEVPIGVKYSDYSLSKGQNFFVGLKTFFRLLLKKLIS